MTIFKEIGFDDIREGDTIRITDIREVNISQAGFGSEVKDQNGCSVLRPAGVLGAKRKFHLLNRPIPKIPTKVGSLIKLQSGGGTWILVAEMSGEQMIWIRPENGARQSVDFMQSRVNSAGGFEVIL